MDQSVNPVHIRTPKMKRCYTIKNIPVKLLGIPGSKIPQKNVGTFGKKAFFRKFIFIFFFLQNTAIDLWKKPFKFKFFLFFMKYYDKFTGKRLFTNIFLQEFPGDFAAGHTP